MPSGTLCAYSKKQQDVFSFTGNQASLAEIKQTGIGFFSEQRFLIKNYSSHQLAFVAKGRNINFGVQFNHAGVSNFNESSIGLAVGKKLSDKIDVGVQFNLNTEKVYAGSRSTDLNAEGGIILHLTPILNVGIYLFNPAGIIKPSEKNLKNPAVFKFGVGYDVSDDFYLSAEILKEADMPATIQAGFQYQYRKKFFTRFVYVNHLQRISFSSGISHGKFRIGIHVSTHPNLGFTPGLSVLILNNTNKK